MMNRCGKAHEFSFPFIAVRDPVSLSTLLRKIQIEEKVKEIDGVLK